MIDKEAHDPSREYEGNPRQRAQPGTLWPMRMSVRAFSLFNLLDSIYTTYNAKHHYSIYTRYPRAECRYWCLFTLVEQDPTYPAVTFHFFWFWISEKKANSHVWIRTVIVVHCFLCLCISGHESVTVQCFFFFGACQW